MSQLYSKLIGSLALPWVSVLTHSNFWQLYQRLRRDSFREACAPSRDEQLDRLQELLRFAYGHVPFYRERMDALGLPPKSIRSFEDFSRLTPTTKADIAANFPDRLTASEQTYKPWRYVSTSGTVERLTVIQDFRKRDLVRATQLLALDSATGYQPGMRYMEIPPDICRNVCGVADTVEPGVFGYFLEHAWARKLTDPEVVSNLRGMIERQLIYRLKLLPSFGAEGLVQQPATLDQYLQQIDNYRPHVLKALPAYLYLLALHMQERKLPPPRITGGLMPMGSSASPHMKAVIESAFGRGVHEDYGCAELGAIAAECGSKQGLHPFAGLFFVEIVRNGNAVRDGQLGRVLITDLYNYAMPLLRYDIGDVGILRRDPCKCGLPGDRLEIHGRLQDCLVAGDGDVVTPDRLTDLMIERSDVLGFQLELRDRRQAFLQVVPRNGKTANLDEIRKLMRDLLGSQLEIQARHVPTVLPEPGGKFRLVKNASAANGIL